MIHLMVRPR